MVTDDDRNLRQGLGPASPGVQPAAYSTGSSPCPVRDRGRPKLAALGALLVFAVGAVTLAFQTLFFVILGNPSADAAYQPALPLPFCRVIRSALPLAGVAPHRGVSAAGMRPRTGQYERRHHNRPTVVAGVNIRRSGALRVGCYVRAPCGSALSRTSSLPGLSFQARMSSRVGRGAYERRSLGGAPHVMVTHYTDAERSAAVATFDARYGEMEQVLWCLSVNSRAGLLVGESSPALEVLVWTVKSWWGVQGVRSETKAQMARALAESAARSPDLFGQVPDYGPDSVGFARERVAELVSRSMALGVPRREYSLSLQGSSLAHALAGARLRRLRPRGAWRPGLMGSSRGIPEGRRRDFRDGADHDRDHAWIGSLEPSSPLRALDKLTWWVGGGSASPAAEVRDPWQVTRGLGLALSERWPLPRQL